MYDSADAFDDCDCADALLQIRGHPLTIPRTPVDDAADILDDAAENCGLPTRTIRGFCKVSCDKYCT